MPVFDQPLLYNDSNIEDKFNWGIMYDHNNMGFSFIGDPLDIRWHKQELLTWEEVDSNFAELKQTLITETEETGQPTYTPDLATIEGFFKYTLNQNTNFLPSINTDYGKHGLIIIAQDETGDRECTFDSLGYVKVGDWPNMNKYPEAISVIHYEAMSDGILLIKLLYTGKNPRYIFYKEDSNFDQDVDYDDSNIQILFFEENLSLPPVVWDRMIRHDESNITDIFYIATELYLYDSDILYDESNMSGQF